MCTVQYCVPQESGVDKHEDDRWEQQVGFPSILLGRVREYATAVRHSHGLRKASCEEEQASLLLAVDWVRVLK